MAGLEVQDCTVEADITPIAWGGDPYAALIVRYTESDHYFAIWIHSAGVLLQEWGHGEHHTNHDAVWAGMSHVEGQTYHVKATVEGEHVTMWVDDVEVMNADYPILEVAGLVGASVAETPEAYFDIPT